MSNRLYRKRRESPLAWWLRRQWLLWGAEIVGGVIFGCVLAAIIYSSF